MLNNLKDFVDGEENKVYKLKKALYGLKQAPRAWYTQIDSYFIENGFIRSKNGEKFRNEMMKKYEMSDMGLLHYFLGIEVYQEEDGVFICQKRKEDGGKMVDETHFRSLVGNLLYLTATRPDIMFAASLLSRFMHYPSHLHLGAAKRVLRYLQGTVELGIKYFRNIEVKLISHCDSDWGGCSVAQSSAEAEYISAPFATSQAIWLRRILEDIKEKQNEATYLLCDNKSAIAIAKNYVFHSRLKLQPIGLIRLMGCGLLVPAASVLRKLVEMEEFPPVSAGLLSLPTCHIQLQRL
ncbi:Retrovirus-related Pol polyprotein from transposon RE1 [Vitis vinifera]|uniref:Retrovirus-related Pol polyprotein from transposon RE1 n=1 Tax=Vitis vinifera TaxID=29760 RepID=A0A438IQX2_VITVI|nr:Retrovirus-related Pol polyprotein from transposon RE1 [Vitis vinifera]